MPRFLFHVADGVRQSDPEIFDFPDNATAKIEAVKFAGELLRSEPEELWKNGQWRVEITDEEKKLMWSVMMIATDTPASNDETGRIENG